MTIAQGRGVWYNDGERNETRLFPKGDCTDMKKRLLCALLCAVLLAGLIPAAALTASAATAEGDWTVYRFANEYCDDDCEHTDDEYGACDYRPEAGYKYTAEGFTVVPANYGNYTPQLSVMSKMAKPVKEGIYLKFRVDDYAYDGGRDADQWIALTLTTEKKVLPGSLDFGGGWMTLIRGKGDGICSMIPHLTDPNTEESLGSFINVGTGGNTAPRDNQGREIYTLEVTWDGSAYEMKLNGTPIPGSAETTALLEKLNPEGEFFVGIQMQSTVKDGAAALTILQYGTCEANATTPVGSDSKGAEEHCGFGYADILEPSVVPMNQPAILWNPDTVNMKDGYNSSIEVLGDNTWHVRATDLNSFFYFTPKYNWSYAAEDFPVFGILLRNFWSDGGTLWYCAGDILQPENACTVPFNIYDGEFYGENEEYVFIPVDLTDLWAGRIHNMRLDFMIGDENAREFDICFAGMFRNKDEAYAYAGEWMSTCKGYYPETQTPTTEHPGQDCDGEPTEPPYEPPVSTQPPVIWETISPDETETPAEPLIDREQAVEDILAKYGCTGSLGAVTLPAVAAAAVALTKKKE